MNAPLHPLEQKLNSIKHQLFPLRQHAVTSDNPAVIEAYSTLLAAILRGQPSISPEQDMVFRRLLQSMNLDGQQAQLLAKGGQLSAKELLECIELVKQSDKKNALVLDALILLRINRHLSKPELSLISELSAALSIHEQNFKMVQFWLIEILGINKSTSNYEPVIRKYERPSEWVSGLLSIRCEITKLDKDYIERGEVIIDSTKTEFREYAKTSGIVLTSNPKFIYIIAFPRTFSTWIDFIDFSKLTGRKSAS
ncbi:hypothetical protein [Photobacterium ganghwense]|uniref:hypothetical protein n=1 Tax=Photobacterium ganghwense TaxID=320778 RepID=UPI001A904B50|nr:hypothetical protein [Photobacterium ganghwense]QSV17606.1 hypothetical protein FH974_25280 [Photobacterium ganghwense]